ncbi:hypothetical protein XW59_029140 [Aquamicrobium sp. LC103]|nr:hypothetical protein XW59_029140 [Aquamicrobium sp. LC103]
MSVAMTDKEDEEDVRALAAKVASDLSEYGMTLATMLLRLDQASRKLDDARKAAGKLHEEEH